MARAALFGAPGSKTTIQPNSFGGTIYFTTADCIGTVYASVNKVCFTDPDNPDAYECSPGGAPSYQLADTINGTRVYRTYKESEPQAVEVQRLHIAGNPEACAPLPFGYASTSITALPFNNVFDVEAHTYPSPLTIGP